jgi:hypothetical protein
MTEAQTEGVTPEENTPAAEPTANPDVAKLQSALQKEREARKAADARAKEFESYRDKVAKLEEAGKSDLEKAVEAARKEGAQTAMQTANARLVKAEARALAASAKFRDPSDAVAFLGDLSTVRVSSEGDVDADSLKAALDDLAKAKPYLLAEEKPTRPTGDAGQGPRDAGPVDGRHWMNEAIRTATGRA